MSSGDVDVVASPDQNNTATEDKSNQSHSPVSDSSSNVKVKKTPTSWEPEDDVLLMHLKEVQKLGWKQIASHCMTANSAQFRWRRLKSGNLKNLPKSAAALGDKFKQNQEFLNSGSSSKKKKTTQTPSQTPTLPKPESTDNYQYNNAPSGGFQGFDNNISTALAGLNALSNSPSYIPHSNVTTPKMSVASPNNNGPPTIVTTDSNNIETTEDQNYENSPESDLELVSRSGINIPGGTGGYYTELAVDPTINLPHNRSHPETPSSLTPRNSTSHIKDHANSISVAASALRNNSIIQITNDDRASISSITRASVSSLPSKSMNIPHHQSGNNQLAHLPVLFGGAGSISGPSRNSSISGAGGVHQTTVSSLRNGSLAGASSGYYSRSGSVVIPHNTNEEPLKIDKEKIEASNKKLQKLRRSLPSSTTSKKRQQNKKLDLPWAMEEDELLINRRNRELSFAELSILLPQRTEGEIWSRIDHLEKLRNGNDRNAHSRDPRKIRQSSIGLDDVNDLYDDDDDDDVIGDIGVSDDDDDENALVDVDDVVTNGRNRKRRASSAINPLARRPIRRLH
ncbi:uncharacterized protein KGF55_000228 [Candida pseudojiufengensis]|uniref:uncharacterized protein n=1 Tax=Candida pseudojiufengensis TaxID=497109 RepID=UPI0022248CF8|nr:uncharacterized protein KGF55_000228 [Candida pseudojiufengensis]KAI5966819.1 hypothetical protein KGF55_000228 [Candida pseudojiufengensis]